MRIVERTLYPSIINYLKEKGFKGVQEVEAGGKYPDIVFWIDSIKAVIQVKIGKEQKIIEGMADVSEHARKLETDNMIVIVYPSEAKKIIKSPEDVDKVALNYKTDNLVLTRYWTTRKEMTVSELFDIFKKKTEKKETTIDINFVIKALKEAVEELSYRFRSYSKEEIDNTINMVIGRFDLFLALGEAEKSNQADLRLAAIDLAAYLLMNQILFYHIFSTLTADVPKIKKEIKSNSGLKYYFNKITHIDYKAIYSLDILSNLPKDEKLLERINKIIQAIQLIRVEFLEQDLLGRIFHEFLPQDTRKKLAAFYTHPFSAELLAGLTIDTKGEKIMDPSCGSGTLLVAGYHRKKNLYNDSFNQKIHKKFVEEEITGTDIMPFAVHLAAINLSTQNIKFTTNKLRIGIHDALDLEIGKEIGSFRKFIESSLFPDYISRVAQEGAVGLEKSGEKFNIEKVNTVIMNPPFSDREKLPKDYRDKLLGKGRGLTPGLKELERIRINKLIEKCGGRVNLWGYFLALADELIAENGKMGAIIPINILRGEATQRIRDFIFSSYHIRYILKTTKELAFTEGAAFRDILFIIEKSKPKTSDKVAFVLLKKSIRNEMNVEEIHKIISLLRKAKPSQFISNDLVDLYWIPRKEIDENKNNLMPFIWAIKSENRNNVQEFLNLIRRNSQQKLKGLVKKDISEGFHASPKGLSDLTFITNPFQKDRAKRAFLILSREESNNITATIKNTKLKFRIGREILLPALRTLTNISTFNLDKQHDYFITGSFPGYKKLINISSWKDKSRFSWDFVKEGIRGKETNLVVARRFNIYSNNTHFVAFYNDQKFIAPDTFKIIKTQNENEAKIYCLAMNSILFLTQLFTLKEETTGQYTDIRESELIPSSIIDYKKLSSSEKNRLLNLFEELKSVEFPSLIEQIKDRFWARIKLDKAILEILGFKEKDKNRWLNLIYNSLVEELCLAKSIK